jgi:transcriptional regulator GlxA family with amidase domain
LIAWLGQAASPGHPEVLRDGRARRRVAKLAQEFIEERYRESFRIEDLCRETQVGVRTLQRCFREYFGITITMYLETVRLDGARRGLLAAEPEGHSVTEIAMNHGFKHLGRFSTRYRERFGESPKQTLRRTQATAT